MSRSLCQTVSTYDNLAHQLKKKWTRWQTKVVDGLKSIKCKWQMQMHQLTVWHSEHDIPKDAEQWKNIGL